MEGDFIINFFDYDNNKLTKKFFNLIFQSGLLFLIHRATRVKRATATAIDHIITDVIFESTMHPEIISYIYQISKQLQQKKDYKKTKIH